jgi:phosphate uptake regulator
MRRKIIKQGHNTLTITLPSDWVKKLNLKSGDELDVIENNGELLVNAKQHSLSKKQVLEIDGLSVPLLWRFFQSIYREGYEEIKLIFDPEKQYEGAYNYYATQFDYSRLGEKPTKKNAIDMIQGLVDRFIGMEIIDHGENYCIIREMGEPSSKEFENSLRRVFLLIQDLFEKTIELMKNNKVGDINICKTLHSMDINVDRFIDYCCRINNQIKDSSLHKNKQIIFSTLFLLELLGDEFKYIGNHLAHSKKGVHELVNFTEVVKKHFDMYYSIFYKFNKHDVIMFGEHDYKIYDDHFHLKDSPNKDIRGIERHLMQISKFIFCLMELRIEMEY